MSWKTVEAGSETQHASSWISFVFFILSLVVGTSSRSDKISLKNSRTIQVPNRKGIALAGCIDRIGMRCVQMNFMSISIISKLSIPFITQGNIVDSCHRRCTLMPPVMVVCGSFSLKPSGVGLDLKLCYIPYLFHVDAEVKTGESVDVVVEEGSVLPFVQGVIS
ncbi:unnamed protein product [Lactuca saligna]|uniref:Uncharacterized protein n=1 Tax=Lactuca saligna TaxID=75948 RepID=A0AA35ZYN5_LACSI|nr:unnamed protein product [Lactuca saligna]